MRPNDIHCLKCKFYHSTWDSNLPRGCHFFKIKSMSMPSYLVKKESGQECHAYAPKLKFIKEKEFDLNDPKNW